MSSETNNTTAQSFAMYDMEEGGQVSINGEIVVGAEVMVVDGEGNSVPAPDGEHVLTGVGKIKTEGGKITEIMPMEEPQTEAPVEVNVEASEDMGEVTPMPDHAKEMEMMKERMNKLEAMCSELMGKIEKMTKATETMSAVVEEIASMPTAEVSKPASFTYINPKEKQTNNFDNLLKALK